MVHKGEDSLRIPKFGFLLIAGWVKEEGEGETYTILANTLIILSNQS